MERYGRDPAGEPQRGGCTLREQKGLRRAWAPGRLRGGGDGGRGPGRAGRGGGGAQRSREGGVGAGREPRARLGEPRSPGPAGASPPPLLPAGSQGLGDTHGVEQVEGAQAVLGTREASANHLGARGSAAAAGEGGPPLAGSLLCLLRPRGLAGREGGREESRRAAAEDAAGRTRRGERGAGSSARRPGRLPPAREPAAAAAGARAPPRSPASPRALIGRQRGTKVGICK